MFPKMKLQDIITSEHLCSWVTTKPRQRFYFQKLKKSSFNVLQVEVLINKSNHKQKKSFAKTICILLTSAANYIFNINLINYING